MFDVSRRSSSSGRGWNTVWLASAASVGGLIALGFVLHQLSLAIATHSNELSSKSYLDILRATQAYYSSEIASNAASNRLDVRIDYRDKQHAIPFPATFMRELSGHITADDNAIAVRVFSEHPFANVSDREPLDWFESEALAHFAANPSASHFAAGARTEGQSTLRYAVPIRMGPTCVACHNSHPDSPRMDWRVGDLRGAMAIEQPIVAWTALQHPSLFGWIALAGLIVLTLTICVVAIVARVDRRNASLRSSQQQIEQLARTDPVCGIANRRRLVEEIELRFATNNRFAVLLLDLTNFKAVNDAHGHAVGDELLRAVADRLATAAPERAMIARLGGDEFALLIEDEGKAEEDRIAIGRAIVEALGQPYGLAGKRIHTGAAVGYAPAAGRKRDAETLLSEADAAMYHARAHCEDRTCVFHPVIAASAAASKSLARHVDRALEQGEFALYYSPIVDLQSGRLFGVEGLARWIRPNDGILTPDRFMRAAVDHGLMAPMAEQLAERAARDVEEWSARGFEPERVSINIHPLQFKDPEHLARLARSITAGRLSAERVCFEITESCVLGRGAEHNLRAIANWREAGFGVSLDHFGAGLASIAHLRELPITELKLDGAMVRRVDRSKSDRAVIGAILEFATALDLRAIAEAIDTEEQRALLLELGYGHGQGRLFADPRPPAEFPLPAHAAAERPRAQRPMRSQRNTSMTENNAAAT